MWRCLPLMAIWHGHCPPRALNIGLGPEGICVQALSHDSQREGLADPDDPVRQSSEPGDLIEILPLQNRDRQDTRGKLR